MRDDARMLLQIASVDLAFAQAEIRLFEEKGDAIERISFHIDRAIECLKSLEEQTCADGPEKRSGLE